MIPDFADVKPSMKPLYALVKVFNVVLKVGAAVFVNRQFKHQT